MEANEQPAPGLIDPATVSAQAAPADTGVSAQVQTPEGNAASAMAADQGIPNQPSAEQPISDPAGPAQTIAQDPAQQAQGQAYTQPQQSQIPSQTVVTDPVTGQLYLSTPQGLVRLEPVQGLPAGGPPPPQYTAGTAQQQTYSQVPPTDAPKAADYTQIIKSVEAFAEGDATVADVVKTLYTETAQDDQFWKGAVVGAAATVLLTSDTIRGAMGKTLTGLFGAVAGAGAASATDSDTAKGDDAKDFTNQDAADQGAADRPDRDTEKE